MTTVYGTVRRRGLTLDAFTDVTGPEVLIVAPIKADRIVFNAEITAEQVHAIWLRMESTDDADQARRAQLRTDRDALAADDPLRRLYDYMLGD